MFGIFATTKDNLDTDLGQLSEEMRAWTLEAARGECGWICADCSCSFPAGMPDKCLHGHQGCTDIIKRDKALAMGAPTITGEW